MTHQEPPVNHCVSYDSNPGFHTSHFHPPPPDVVLSFLGYRESTSLALDYIPSFQHIGYSLVPALAQDTQGKELDQKQFLKIQR